MLKLHALTATLLAIPVVAAAQDYPKKIPAPGGHVIIPAAGAQRAYDDYKYAPARRAGDFLYISGVVVGPAPDQGRDVEGFKAGVRRAFNHIKLSLAAEGLTFADVVMINSFHVWQGPGFAGTRDEQFAAVSAVKDEFMSAPHPAWTAVGTTGLLMEGGVVEIQMIAYAPQKR
ncbi:RidA family protein [Phenylobacterium sp. J426]|uniref:Rid family hydrolase n=1 Tax=Phenylobacterium sp. J426 TaxID=2898439 RepID=UPI0021513719|nr:Rid family hydrolase [Phenylobacterium sp. J426]MCR5872866.1 RidA family protein [Phenylobacterium sp. J426]